jgi:hypothetical protein
MMESVPFQDEVVLMADFFFFSSAADAAVVCVAGALAFPVVDWLANSSMVMLSGEAPGVVELWPTQVSRPQPHGRSTPVHTRNLRSTSSRSSGSGSQPAMQVWAPYGVRVCVAQCSATWLSWLPAAFCTTF